MKKNVSLLFAAVLTMGFAVVAQAQTADSDVVEMVQLEDGQVTGGQVTERQPAPGARDWATTPQPPRHGPGYPQPYPPHYPHPVPPPYPAPYPAPYPQPYPTPYYPPAPGILTCYARGNMGYVYYGTSTDMYQASTIAMNICQSTGQFCQPAGCRY